MSKAKKIGISVAMSALVLLGLTTGCGNGSGTGSTDWSWGCLTEADSGGAPAYAELATIPTGQVVRVWSETLRENVTLEVLGGELGDVAPGAHEAGPDGMILADDLVLEVRHCEGQSMEDAVCSNVDAASIEIDVLDDGARRVSYRGTSVEGGETVPVEGSFVVGR